MRNNRDSEPNLVRYAFVHCSERYIESGAPEGSSFMNTNPDFSFVYGIASSVIGLCVMLTVWLVVRGSRKTNHTKQLGRQWRKQ